MIDEWRSEVLHILRLMNVSDKVNALIERLQGR